MPQIQTTYASTYTAAFVGMIANQETRNIISLAVQDATLAFGAAVFQGATDNACTSVPGTRFRGIAIVDKSVPAGSSDAYVQMQTASVATLGVVWVVAAHAVAAGEPVFVTSSGAFTDVSTGDTAIPNATFDSSAASGALVKIRLS